MKTWYKYGRSYLPLLLLCTSALIYFTNRYVLTAAFYENNGDPFSEMPGQSAAIYQALQKWVYLSSALFLIVKLFTISLILHTALYLNDHEVRFENLFRVVVLAEFIFLIPASIKLITFNYAFEHGNLLDWHRYYILSALSIFDNAPADWYYALQSLNLFEIVYWFILAYGISINTSRTFDDSLRIVVTSYVPALVIWVTSVTFFTLMMFPTTG